ncbi:MAG: gliding motility protein [Deltaproteobacteria bacterium]|nr:gliding motility protein [Deltaproteobacteria bacterium]
MQVDIAHREIGLKFVYYGPALSGKTTNLQALHRVMPEGTAGRLLSLETRDDRTLFFDLLPLRVEVGSGLKIKLKLYTVPGQVIHDATRRLVLQSADGVAFIADSRVSEIESNAESFRNLAENLRANGLDARTISLVIQFNKRDLPDIRTDGEIDAMARAGREPVYKAVATDGKGVIETFLGLLRLTWSHLQAEHKFEERFGVDSRQLLLKLASQLGLPKHLAADRDGDRLWPPPSDGEK